MRKITHSPEETIEFAKEIGSKLKGGDVIAYIGGLALVKLPSPVGLLSEWGLRMMLPPTFAIVNEYRGKINLYHFDMYRIMNTESLETTGFFDYLSDDNVLAIEWSENIKDT